MASRLALIMTVSFAGLLLTSFNVKPAESFAPLVQTKAAAEVTVARFSLDSASLAHGLETHYTNPEAAAGTVIPVVARLLSEADIASLDAESRSVLNRRNAFLIEAQQDEVRITGKDTLGLRYAMELLESLVADNSGSITFKQIVDAPDHGIRALHVVMRSMSPDEIRHVIDLGRQARFNTLVIAVTDQVRWDSTAVTPRADAMSKNDFVKIVEYARSLGMEVVPELSLLTHQGRYFRDSHPELMFNAQTYDPRNEDTYALVFEHIQEIIEAISPQAFHIGHDEVYGTYNKKKMKRPVNVLPPKLFVQDVIKLNAFLQERGIETWMWGDMLSGQLEFPGMNKNNLHGNGAYAGIRKQIPKNIVVCDWHYWGRQPDFPSSKALIDNGNRVLGTTWKKPQATRNFSRYVNKVGGDGMIATLWSLLQKREWEEVERIISSSGQIFWRSE